MTTHSGLGGANFDPETTSLLIAAFEAAWETIRKSGSPLAGVDQAASTRELLAKYLIERVQAGERNRQALIDEALVHLASPR